jgi:hypothetical protein
LICQQRSFETAEPFGVFPKGFSPGLRTDLQMLGIGLNNSP